MVWMRWTMDVDVLGVSQVLVLQRLVVTIGLAGVGPLQGSRWCVT